MTTDATDYLWFADRFPGLAEAYCCTLVRDLAPAEVVRRLGGREESPLTGADALTDAAYDFFVSAGEDRGLVGMTTVGDWTLLIEPNGYQGITEDRALPASAGTCWVSHFVNVNGHDLFLWAENGLRRLSFEPLFPDTRWGADADADHVREAMRRAGFQFGEDDPEHPLCSEAAFAFAEHLTGTAVTPDLLERTTFSCGSVALG